MPTTPDAVRLCFASKIACGPAKAANAGGVATSALEMQQNASRQAWTFQETEQHLSEIMTRIHEAVRDTAEEFGAPGNYVVGANIAGLLHVAKAMVALGLI
jgi:glutamate dehydrogenase (NADP+)